MTTLALLVVAATIPFAIYAFLSSKAGQEPLPVELPVASFAPSPISFSHSRIGPEPSQGQLFTNVSFADVDQDSKLDVIACDALRGEVAWYRNDGKRADENSWSKNVMNPTSLLPSPSHVTPMDLDQDGDEDYLIACLGRIQPTNDKVGRLVWLENDAGEFTIHEILTDVRRVTDVQGGDFDGDGDFDLVAAVFGGPLQGQILYLENDGSQRFTDYEMLAVSGTIHVPVHDFDGDGDLDVAAVLTQDEEEVVAFVNDGTGFKKPAKRNRIFSSWNFDLGGAGMIANDLDQDGDQDLLLSLGDNLELMHNYPQPWHGCIWLENTGDWKFEPHRIANVGGVYGTAVSDLEGDGDRDVVLVTMFNDWSQKNAASVVWLQNDGQQNFQTFQIASEPVQLATVACADLDNDGQDEIVTGSFHFRRPFDRFGSVDIFSRPSRSGGDQ